MYVILGLVVLLCVIGCTLLLCAVLAISASRS